MNRLNVFEVMSRYIFNCVTESAAGCWMLLENHVKMWIY